HLDQLLPIAAIAGEAGDFAGRYRADLPEADFGHHPFEPDAWDATRGRPLEIVVHRVDLGPAERHKTIPHSILQCLALAVVQDLVGRGLPYIEDRLACQMMRLDLVRHHGAFPPSWAADRRVRGRR